ncbi:myosin V [Homalodisca vitripennis]|nr:myosin V [Homalodisca vitripennis]
MPSTLIMVLFWLQSTLTQSSLSRTLTPHTPIKARPWMEKEQRDPSIITSEAGKMVSTKYVMQYFATVDDSTTKTHIERKFFAFSPITEVIRNAMTTVLLSESLELQFSWTYNIIGPAGERIYWRSHMKSSRH